MSSFTLRAEKPLKPGQAWYYMQNLKDENLAGLTVQPTDESIQNGTLEWIIPDVPFNRVHLRQNYPNFEIIELGEEVVKKKPPMSKPVVQDKKPEVPEPAKEKVGFIKRTFNPMEVKKLKIKIMKELDAIGVEYPKTATLKLLQEIAAKNK